MTILGYVHLRQGAPALHQQDVPALGVPHCADVLPIVVSVSFGVETTSVVMTDYKKGEKC